MVDKIKPVIELKESDCMHRRYQWPFEQFAKRKWSHFLCTTRNSPGQKIKDNESVYSWSIPVLHGTLSINLRALGRLSQKLLVDTYRNFSKPKILFLSLQNSFISTHWVCFHVCLKIHTTPKTGDRFDISINTVYTHIRYWTWIARWFLTLTYQT